MRRVSEKQLFLFVFYCCSLSFPPKLYAAMENNYAPSNGTLLILATRTGKGFRHIGTQAHTQIAFRIVLSTFCCEKAASESQLVILSCCILHIDYISYVQSVQSQMSFNLASNGYPGTIFHLHSSPF